MPFLNRVPLTQTCNRSGTTPSSLRQFAAARATDMGSVQPSAGTTSRRNRVTNSAHWEWLDGVMYWILLAEFGRPNGFISQSGDRTNKIADKSIAQAIHLSTL
jgi:hypothetical protein